MSSDIRPRPSVRYRDDHGVAVNTGRWRRLWQDTTIACKCLWGPCARGRHGIGPRRRSPGQSTCTISIYAVFDKLRGAVVCHSPLEWAGCRRQAAVQANLIGCAVRASDRNGIGGINNGIQCSLRAKVQGPCGDCAGCGIVCRNSEGDLPPVGRANRIAVTCVRVGIGYESVAPTECGCIYAGSGRALPGQYSTVNRLGCRARSGIANRQVDSGWRGRPRPDM